MQIAQTLAGFTAGEADILRRAMGKKKAELDKQKEDLLRGCKKWNKKDVANYVFTKLNHLLNMVLIKVMLQLMHLSHTKLLI